MKKSTKRLLLRIVFWGAILAAPVAFIAMVFVYLNAYVTGDRVNSVMIPLFEGISERAVQIESTDAHIGLTSSFEFHNIRFFEKSGELDATYSPAETHIGRMSIQLKPLTLFTRSFQVDSLVIEGFHGSITYRPGKTFSQVEWRDGEETITIDANFNRRDLESIHIKSLAVKNSTLHYIHTGMDLEYLVEDLQLNIEVRGVRAMNMILVNGTVGGILKNSKTKDIHADIMLSGRLQINFDDDTFILRGGNLKIDKNVFPFTAFVTQDNETERLTILFDEPSMITRDVFQKLPPSIEQWLHGNLPGSRYRVHINYSGENGTDQT